MEEEYLQMQSCLNTMYEIVEKLDNQAAKDVLELTLLRVSGEAAAIADAVKFRKGIALCITI